MPGLPLKQILIIGYPNVGKSKFLKKRSRQKWIFTPIKKEGKILKYPFLERSFRETQKRTRDFLLRYIRNHSTLYLDEPFYYLLPFEEGTFFEIFKKSYTIVEHRIAYFLLSRPSITLINKKGFPININILELEKLVRKPSLNFFEADLMNYSNFLNQFNDIHLSPILINKIKNHPDFKNTRTTYFIRDFLIWFVLHPSDLNKKIDEYKIIINNFFQENYKSVPKDYQRVIKKCLGSFYIPPKEI